MDDEYANKLLEMMFRQAKAQFGDAVKSFWFNEGDACPGCGGIIDAVDVEGEQALSLNGFMYRKRGVLIGYFLCSYCVEYIFQESRVNPFKQTPLHATIEANLIDAYHNYINSLDA